MDFKSSWFSFDWYSTISYDDFLEYGLVAFIALWIIPYFLSVPLTLYSMKKRKYQKVALATAVLLSPVATGLIYLWVKKLKAYFGK